MPQKLKRTTSSTKHKHEYRIVDTFFREESKGIRTYCAYCIHCTETKTVKLTIKVN